MTRTYDNHGRQIVSLSWLERAVLGAAAALLIAAVSWVGVQVVDMRDSVRTLGTFRAQDRHDLDDHESRLRYIERHP